MSHSHVTILVNATTFIHISYTYGNFLGSFHLYWDIRWSRRILVATHPFLLDPHHYFFFSFLVSLIVAQFTIFGSFSGSKLVEPFWGPKRHFFGIEWSGKYESVPKLIFVIYGCIPWIDISNDVSCTSNRGIMPKLRPRKIDVLSYPTGHTFWRFTS